MKKKLIIQLARFGDVMQTRRLIESLIYEDIASSNQKNEIVLCVDKLQENIAKILYPHIEIIGFHAYNADARDVLLKNRKILDYIKSSNFDEVYTLNFTAMTYALIKIFDEEKVRGYKFSHGQETKSAWHDLTYKYMYDRLQSPLHITDFWAFLADKAIEPEKVNPSAYEKMQTWLEGKGTFEVGIILSGQHRRRSVPPKDLALIVHVLASRFDKVRFNLLGTAGEADLAREFFTHLPKNTTSLVNNRIGKTKITELLDIIKESDLVLSPDTGSLHAAAFFGVPTLSFFHSSALCYQTGAYGLGHLCLQSTFPCAPCLEVKPCPYGDDIYCYKQLSSPALLAFLAKQKTQKKIEYCALLETEFDNIGHKYKLLAGDEVDRRKAHELREVLYEYRYAKTYQSHNALTETVALELFEGPFTFFLNNKV